MPDAATADRPVPFSVRDWFDAPRRRLFAPVGPLVDSILGLRALGRLYHGLPHDDRPFCDLALEALQVRSEVTAGDGIPRSGPLIVVANHPHGALDGLILASLLLRIRPDLKILANHLLGRIPELRSLLLPVDPFRSSAGTMGNVVAARSAMRWVDRGGPLVVFPAGEVSHVRSDDGRTVDPPWAPGIAKLVRQGRADVVPVFIEGGNSAWFRLAGAIHPRLRTALLPRELLRQRHRTIAVRAGAPIPFARLERYASDEEMTAYLRIRTDALGGAAVEIRNGSGPGASAVARIAGEPPAGAIAQELRALPAGAQLCRSGAFTVYVGAAGMLNRTLLEIGRLREITFRAAGEGTGRDRDLDEFDESYLHLFVWNHERREIVGAYRMGPTDAILPRHGTSGLYTSTLFRYDRRLLEQIDPALELGRAFVRPEYQRDYRPLMLLWKGIGTFVSRHPRYRRLFGCVSISSDYQSLSQQILAAFLHTTSYRADLAQLVRPKNPPPFFGNGRQPQPVIGSIVRTVAEVGALLAEIEADRKGVPVLLRHYLKLDAKLLGFNVDPAFGNVLDGLMLVDLLDVNREILTRYMGAPGAAAFRAHHADATRRAS